MKNQSFENLFKETEEHLLAKRYLYKPPKKKNGIIVKDRYGNILYNPITPHKNVMLSLAFNMAYENYRNLRVPYTGVKDIKEIKEIAMISDMLLRYFSNKYYKNIDDITIDNNLIDSHQNYEYEEIQRFKKIEYKLYGTINRLRNYHSHYIHEPGILKFEDLFKNDKTLSSNDFKEAKEWFYKRFNDTHNHLTQSLRNRKIKLEQENTKESIPKVKQITKVLKSFKYIVFLDEDTQNISLNGQLFMACMFLYKRQAKVILDKWRDVKSPIGYENSRETFFTYYCLSERYSINNFNNNLLKFRDITSKLSTIPYSTNSNLNFIYEKINKINKENYDAINNFEEKANTQNIITNETPVTLEELKSRIMPFRKRHILTSVLLQYLLDNGLITNKYKIAVKKTPTDVIEYYKKYEKVLDKTKNITYLKNEIKKLKKGSEERMILKEHLKELKRNFVFKSPSELIKLNEPIILKIENEAGSGGKTEENTVIPPVGYRFTLKKKNALIQYTSKNGKTANVTLSAQLLIKWVFIHLTSSNNNKQDKNKGFKIITKYIEYYIKNLSKKNNTSENLKTTFFGNPNYTYLKGKGKVFPKSINYNSNNIENIKDETIQENLKFRIETLVKFKNTNAVQNKPWKYEAKGKINTILKYMHFCLVHEVYTNKYFKPTNQTAENFIRHNYFNMTTYNIAREYFRYFGRYKNKSVTKEVQEYSLGVIDNLKKDYHQCFKFINEDITNAKSLEELFETVINKYIEKLESIKSNLKEYSTFQLVTILKINAISNTGNVNAILDSHYAKSFAVSPEIISIKKECPQLWEDFKAEKEKKLNGKPFHCSEYAFIRNYLQRDNVTTNIDFLYKHIIDYEEVGKIKNLNRTTLSKELLQLKTEELILWNIAKTYWLKANGEPYEFNNKEENTSNANYQTYCTFNKVYNKELDYTIKIDKGFWKKTKGSPDNKVRFKNIYDLNLDEITFTIKVPARKYDNKFLSVETKLIKEYCLWNHFNMSTKKVELSETYEYINKNKVRSTHNIQKYEGLMKMIYKQLKSSVSDIGLILSAEKKIVDNSINKYLDILTNKYKGNNEISDFFLAFTNTISTFENDDVIFKDFISKINSSFLDKKQTIEEYLVSFRNFALHYQLQNPDSQKIITNFLNNINNYKDAKENEYYIKE